MSIKRIGTGPRMSKAVVHGDTVYISGQVAGKPVPSHMRDAFPDLINPKTHRFKRELVRSLATKELKQAKRLTLPHRLNPV